MTIRSVVKNNTGCAVAEDDGVVVSDVQSALDLLMTAKYEAGTEAF